MTIQQISLKNLMPFFKNTYRHNKGEFLPELSYLQIVVFPKKDPCELITEFPELENLPNLNGGPEHLFLLLSIASGDKAGKKYIIGDLAFAYEEKILSIKEIQGTKLKELPKDVSLRVEKIYAFFYWERFLIETIIRFAKEWGGLTATIKKSRHSLWYKTAEEIAESETWSPAYAEFQRQLNRRLERRYDETARQLGFVDNGSEYWAKQLS